jgi:hypothetical protein
MWKTEGISIRGLTRVRPMISGAWRLPEALIGNKKAAARRTAPAPSGSGF